MSLTILGKCPKCGSVFANGKYGPYCTGKCGFRLKGEMYGKKLTKEQISSLLNGDRILLKDVESRKGGNTYDMYLYPDKIKPYSYVGKDGSERSGYEYSYKTSFPDSYPQYDNFSYFDRISFGKD